MNYPLWDLPAPGLLIAFVAIVHVFVSHFAVGGGLFLVVTEIKARREHDEDLLAYLKRHSRFFALLTLVFGAVTGVGIWFTIGVVHPAATSTLINTFVFGWAIEWTFFLAEIAAAIVYFYGWERLTAKQHVLVGWIYFVAAWASLLVINGILSFMLTPGRWLETHTFWSGYFNPTFWPSLVIRTLGAMGLAGVYALFTASWMTGPEVKAKLARYAAMWWVLPMAVGLPLCLAWYFHAASAAGVPVAEFFGTATANTGEILSRVLTTTSPSGQPVGQRALRVAVASITATVLLTFAVFLFRRARFGRVITGALMVAALLSIGGSEWLREALRKPYVIGSYMYVTGDRTPVNTEGSVLQRAKFVRQGQHGREVFRLLCSQCHTIDGYLGLRRLLRGQSSGAIESMITHIEKWRGRRMPPFAGNADDRYALAAYLAEVGGGKVIPRAAAVSGEEVFNNSCAICHGEDMPITKFTAGMSEEQLYGVIGQLPERNPAMPPFEGSDAERRALAHYLVGRK